MLRRCLPVASLRPRAGRGRRRWAGGSLEPGGRGGGGRRSCPGRAVAAAAAGAGQTAQPLPPGASLSSPRSWRLQNSLSLSATSLLPLPSLPLRSSPAESPRTGRAEAASADRGGRLGARGALGASLGAVLAETASEGCREMGGYTGTGAGKQLRRQLPWSPDGRVRDRPPRERCGHAGDSPRNHVGSPARVKSLLI